MTASFQIAVRRAADPATGASAPVELSLRIPTSLDLVEEVVDLVARHCIAAGLTPRRARFELRVVLAEALTNAILYGNALDPSKNVEVLVEVDERAVAIHVRDEGDGFDPSRIPDPTTPDLVERPTGRGLFLIRQLADEVHFNDRGNAICMILRCA